MKLRKFDRRLLYHLSHDASLSLTKLAKLMKSSKQLVSYNLNKLVSSGIISMFYSVIDHSRLGYIELRVMIRLSQSSPKKEQEVINYLLKKKSIRRVLVVDDHFDLIVDLVEKDFNNLYEVIISLQEKFGKYIAEIQVDNVRSREMFPFRVFSENPSKKTDYTRVYYKKAEKPFILDDTDRKIIREIEKNCRFDYVKLSTKLHIPPKTIMYRIKRLEKERVIAGYGISINWYKLNKVRYRILIEPLIYNKNKFVELKDFIRAKEEVIAMKQVISRYMVEFDIVVSNYNEALVFLDLIREKFSELIKGYDIVVIKDIIR
ncbi:Lrp/AsnC family transcriptional regulator [Nanoarchaeota archaeon]